MDHSMPKCAVILAGGRGSRLAPYTTVLPKPLMPIGDRAILDVVVRQLHDHGFDTITMAVGYLGHLIEAVFGDGSAHDVSISYHREDKPLGTAGPFTTIEGLSDDHFLAMNGDILTSLSYRDFFDAHLESGKAMTVATHARTVQANYGVLHLNGDKGAVRGVTGYDEKPEMHYTVSMGIYALAPEAVEFIPPGRFDIPDLVLALLEAGKEVGAFEYNGYWLDIGRHDDYEKALRDYEEILPRLLPGEVAAPASQILE